MAAPGPLHALAGPPPLPGGRGQRTGLPAAGRALHAGPARPGTDLSGFGLRRGRASGVPSLHRADPGRPGLHPGGHPMADFGQRAGRRAPGHFRVRPSRTGTPAGQPGRAGHAGAGGPEERTLQRPGQPCCGSPSGTPARHPTPGPGCLRDRSGGHWSGLHPPHPAQRGQDHLGHHRAGSGDSSLRLPGAPGRGRAPGDHRHRVHHHPRAVGLYGPGRLAQNFFHGGRLHRGAHLRRGHGLRPVPDFPLPGGSGSTSQPRPGSRGPGDGGAHRPGADGQRGHGHHRHLGHDGGPV